MSFGGGRSLRFATGAVIALILLPVAGLVAGALDPPVSGFSQASPTLADLVLRSNAGGLLTTTLALALAVSFLALPLGLWLAWLEQRTEYPGRQTLAVLDLLPLAVPSYVLAATVREGFGPGGWIGSLLGLGVFSGFWPSVLVLTVVTVPYVHLLVGAALARSSSAEEEAARSLGASPTQVFRAAVLPRLRPTLGFALVLTQLYVIADFGAVAVLDCPVLNWRLYQAVGYQQLDKAAVLGFAILVAALPLLVLARWIHGAEAVRHVANPRPATRVPLGRLGNTAALAAHTFTIGVGVVLPVAILITWTLGGFVDARSFASLAEPLRHTFLVVAAGGAFTLALAAPAAWTIARSEKSFVSTSREDLGNARAMKFLENGVYATSALPGVLLGFGLMLAALAFARAAAKLGVANDAVIYQGLLGSGLLLGLGYATRFLAEAYAGLKTAVLRLDLRQEETARTLGVSRARWFTRIALPALAPGIGAASVLVGLALVKELPVTLLLGGAMGLRPLSFRVFDRYQEAFLHDAGLAGLVMMGAALLAVTVTLRWRRHA